MAVTSNTGDEFEWDSDEGYENLMAAYNDIDFEAMRTAKMVVASIGNEYA